MPYTEEGNGGAGRRLPRFGGKVKPSTALKRGPLMERYTNLGGDSGVVAYELGVDSITVEFSDGSVYLYTYQSAGSHNIEEMKELAVAGKGLNSFINKNVRKKYASKLK